MTNGTTGRDGTGFFKSYTILFFFSHIYKKVCPVCPVRWKSLGDFHLSRDRVATLVCPRDSPVRRRYFEKAARIVLFIGDSVRVAFQKFPQVISEGAVTA